MYPDCLPPLSEFPSKPAIPFWHLPVLWYRYTFRFCHRDQTGHIPGNRTLPGKTADIFCSGTRNLLHWYCLQFCGWHWYFPPPSQNYQIPPVHRCRSAAPVPLHSFHNHCWSWSPWSGSETLRRTTGEATLPLQSRPVIVCEMIF